MASEDSTRDSFRQRLLAVLDYDGIPERQRVKHVASAGKFSLSTARRMLTVDRDIGNSNGVLLLNLANGLGVSHRWLYDGQFERFDPRTARIQLVMMDGETTEEADAIIKTIASEVPGEPTYAYVGAHDLSTVVIVEQHRRLSEWEKNKNFRFMLRLINDDPKANRLLEMCVRGQITKQQVFQMV